MPCGRIEPHFFKLKADATGELTLQNQISAIFSSVGGTLVFTLPFLRY